MSNNFGPLLEAIEADDRAAVKRLLKADGRLAVARVAKPKLYQQPILHWLYQNDTPLHLAAAGYRVEIARMLLDAGADPRAADNSRRGAPLHYAADGYPNGPAWDPTRQVAMLACLLEAGAELRAPDRNGATALHRAVRTRCADAVSLLLEAGADPLLPNRSGTTPFHLAVQNSGRGGSGAAEAVAQQRRIIETLLARGVSPEAKNAQGKSVRDSAKSPWICDLLAASSG
ncbi:MAG: ankyrin repeat domain-containing protein [Pirellulales bacterium]|nr:ankyrin repeat domain-containing protein [Pirellulales bacterium]